MGKSRNEKVENLSLLWSRDNILDRILKLLWRYFVRPFCPLWTSFFFVIFCSNHRNENIRVTVMSEIFKWLVQQKERLGEGKIFYARRVKKKFVNGRHYKC